MDLINHLFNFKQKIEFFECFNLFKMGNCIFFKHVVKESDIYHCDELQTRSFDQVKKFTFSGMVTKAKITSVHDGDTVEIVFYYKGEFIKDNFRLFGFDAPELKPRLDIENRELHIKAAHVAKIKITEQILDKIVWITFVEEEKYGRLMGMIYLCSKENSLSGSELCINHWMVQNGYGKPYNGGKKAIFSKEDLQYILSK
jgi:endonuclease YncB( thermonuclease family)